MIKICLQVREQHQKVNGVTLTELGIKNYQKLYDPESKKLKSVPQKNYRLFCSRPVFRSKTRRNRKQDFLIIPEKSKKNRDQ